MSGFFLPWAGPFRRQWFLGDCSGEKRSWEKFCNFLLRALEGWLFCTSRSKRVGPRRQGKQKFHKNCVDQSVWGIIVEGLC
jgi:hypothetical protein